MKQTLKRLGTAAAIALLVAGCGGAPPPSPGPGTSPGPGPSPVPGGFDCNAALDLSGVVEVDDPILDRYIVVLRPDAEGAGVGAAAKDIFERYVKTTGATDVKLFDAALQGFSCSVAASGAERIAADPRVIFVQQEGRKSVTPLAGQEADATWGLDRIDQRDLPLDGVFDPGATGTPVHAYVLDTGVDVNHDEFTDRIGEGFSATGGGFLDDNGHGTHVAGTIGGTEFGVAKRVTIHPVKVLVNGSGSDSGVIAGIDWVTRHVRANGWPAIANMSLGGSASPALDLAVCRSIDAGVAYAVAAGNESADACDKSPARVAQALGAGATDRSDARASFSNTGVCVDLFAPGRDIRSARNGGGEVTLSGTSMASPHVAGVAALCFERNPASSPAENHRCVLDHASRDRLSGLGAGSPNLLLYARDE